MSDRPWMKFYPRDWRGDQALRVVSLAARGMWMEMLCVMHEASPYGHLLIGGQPVGDAVLARLVGSAVEEVQALLVELRDARVFRQTRAGVIYSKRMTDDHKRSVAGRKAKEEAIKEAAENTEENNAPSRLPNTRPSTQKPEARDQKEVVVPFPEPTEITKTQQNGESAVRSKGTRLKPDWRPSVDNRVYAVGEGFTEAQVDRIAEDFRDFWTAKSGADAAKLDWTATWRRWVRTERDRKVTARPQAKRQGFV